MNIESLKTEYESVKMSLVCSGCTNKFEMAPMITGCPVCGNSVLEVAYQFDKPPILPSARPQTKGMSKYWSLLPAW